MQLPAFTPPPDETDITLMIGALSESRADLKTLVDYARPQVAELGPDLAISRLVQGMLDSPAWGRLELASVLGVAIVDLATPDADTV